MRRLLLCLWVVPLLLLPIASDAAILNVTKTTDSNDGVCDSDCSLREAVVAANSGGSTVQVPAGTYRLSIPRGVRGDNAAGSGGDGNLVVNATMTITGAGKDVTIIDARPSPEAAGVDRVFSITHLGNLTMSGVTISGGTTGPMGQGGGILSLGGALSLTDSALTDNVGAAGGGGIAVGNGSNLAGTVTITRCEIAGNTTAPSGSGGQGGGLLNIQSTVSVVDSTIRDNTALYSTGGGIMNLDVTSRPSPPAALTVIRSTIADNFAGDPTQTSLNQGVGGGIHNSGGRLVLTNSTVTGNEVTASFAQGFGFIPGTGTGGGVAHQLLLGDDPNDGTSIVNSTIAYNVALTGSQLYGSATINPMFVTNTLVARGGVTTANCASPGSEVGLQSFGGNISSDASPCRFDDPRDETNTNPGLDAALADNGGPTLTIALLEGSIAIGAGREESCPPLDQRGFARKDICDSGAVETVPEAGAAALFATAMGTLAWRARRRGKRSLG